MAIRTLRTETVDELVDMITVLHDMAYEHGKCTACHCYRDIAEEAVELADTLTGHRDLLEWPFPADATESRNHLQEVLQQTEGKHG